MNISNLAVILTDDCNFDCSYCRIPKQKNIIAPSTLQAAIPFFMRHMVETATITFFGGEPLLEYELIRYAVCLFNDASSPEHPAPAYSVTTNGSLLTGDMLDYFDGHAFSLLLSYDGDAHDDCRKRGSNDIVEAALKKIQHYPNIKLSTNSVFTPETIGKLSSSLIRIAELGVADIEFSLDQLAPWSDDSLNTLAEELDRLIRFTTSFNRTHGRIPFAEFRSPAVEEDGLFACGGGKNRMAIAPDGRVWGCTHFHAYFKTNPNDDGVSSYCFGLLDDFIATFDSHYPTILQNHASLRQDMFHSGDKFCFLCDNVNQCKICPVYAARATGSIGDLPPWMCRIAAIMNTAKSTDL